MPDAATVVADTQRWLERAVVGLNLCPFAKAVLVRGQVHFAVCPSPVMQDQLDALECELLDLVAADPQVRDTTLLMLPEGVEDFLEFEALAARGQKLLRRLRLEGVLQIASFHPRFVFADAGEDDITNATNRSPYPTLHLLREDSIDRAVAAFPDPAAIYERNKQVLRELGPAGWAALGVGPSA